jgi:hypothetical protein
MEQSKILKIIKSLNKEKDTIIENIPQEYIDVYCFIHEQYKTLGKKIVDDSLFKFVFRKYYMIRISAQVSEPFFPVLTDFTLNDSDKFEEKVREVLHMLKLRKDKTGEFKMEYSYGSKLLHTVSNRYPIYDSQVRKALGLKEPYGTTPEEKTESFLSVYNEIRQSYEYIIKNNSLEMIIEELKSKRDISKLRDNPIKVLDFIFWAKGRI